MNLRPMQEADLEPLWQLERATVSHPWSLASLRQCLGAGQMAWVAEDGNGLLGYGVIALAADQAELLNLVVARQCQGQGIGRRLLETLVTAAQGAGSRALFLEVRASNGRAQGLYQSVAFEQVGRRKAYYPTDQGREDALLYRLQL